MEIHTLFARLVNLDLLSRHFGLGTAVEAVHVGAAEANARAHAVHGGIAAADHDDLARVRRRVAVGGDFIQELDALLRQLLALAAETGSFPAADRDDDRVKLALQLVERKVFAEFSAEFELDAHLRKVRELAVERRLRQTVFGNAVTQHAAGLRLGFENRRFDPLETQIVRGGKSARPRADDRDLLPGELRKLFHVLIVIKVGRKALEIVDRDRLAVDIAAAVLFAETRADAADRHRQRNPLLDDLQTVQEFTLAAGADILFDIRMGRTGHRTRRLAVTGVLGEQKRQSGFAHIQHFGTRRLDLLPRSGHRGAARHIPAGLPVTDHADEAAGGFGDTAFAAERRNLNSVRGRNFKDGLAGFRRNRPAVQNKFDAHCSEPFLTR